MVVETKLVVKANNTGVRWLPFQSCSLQWFRSSFFATILKLNFLWCLWSAGCTPAYWVAPQRIPSNRGFSRLQGNGVWLLSSQDAFVKIWKFELSNSAVFPTVCLSYFPGRYVDMRCVHNQRALVDSGYYGLRGHVQVIVQNLTESYCTIKDPDPPRRFCMCPSHKHPYCIEHTLQVGSIA